MTTYQNFKSLLIPLIKGEREIAIAVSGGSDSMALALLLNEYAQESGIKIVAITIDHDLRAESAAEAITVGKWLGARGIEHHIIKWEGAKKTSNIQASARKARYSLMAEFCKMRGITSLYVGHTLDDQAETLMMRLMRGSGVDGLSAIPRIGKNYGLRIVRPLLDFARADLREYLVLQKQEWVEDPSNINTKYTRVKVRELIKTVENPALFSKRLAATANHMARAKNYIEEKVRQSLKDVFAFYPEGFCVIKINQFRSLHEEERLRGIVSALQHISGKDYKTRFKELKSLDARIMAGNDIKASTLWGCSIATSLKKNEENLLFIYREPSCCEAHIDITVEASLQGSEHNEPDAAIQCEQGEKNGLPRLTPKKSAPRNDFQWDGRFNCKLENTDQSDLKIGALGKEGYKILAVSALKIEHLQRKSGFIMPKKIIYSLPSLWRLEKLLAVPHIGYYAEEDLDKSFKCEIIAPPNIFKKGSKNA